MKPHQFRNALLARDWPERPDLDLRAAFAAVHRRARDASNLLNAQHLTVGQLIAQLQQFDPNQRVLMEAGSSIGRALGTKTFRKGGGETVLIESD